MHAWISHSVYTYTLQCCRDESQRVAWPEADSIQKSHSPGTLSTFGSVAKIVTKRQAKVPLRYCIFVILNYVSRKCTLILPALKYFDKGSENFVLNYSLYFKTPKIHAQIILIGKCFVFKIKKKTIFVENS